MTFRATLASALLTAVLGPSVLGLAAPASAQDTHAFTLGAYYGVGGSPDTEDGSFSQSTFQLGLGLVTDLKTQVWVRYGQIDFGGERFDNTVDADLSYLTVAGEYRFTESYYESGVYLGLGYYDLSGRSLTGQGGGDSGPGVTVGITGEFDITRRWVVLVDLAGHVVNLNESNVFVTALVGIGAQF